MIHMNIHNGINVRPINKSINSPANSFLHHDFIPVFALVALPLDFKTNNAGKIYIIKGLQVEPINSITGAIPGAKIATVVCIVSNITFNNINRLKLYFFRFLFDDLDDVKSKTSKL